jgi:hypothetical protein
MKQPPEVILLQSAVSEIRRLRKANELMSARLTMFDDMILILKTEVPRRGGSETIDLCWEIENFIEKIPQKPE